MRILLLFLFTGSAMANCLLVETEHITAADISKLVPEFREIPSTEPVAYAPIPGARRIMGAGELRRISARFGLQLDEAPDVCFEYPMQELEAAEVLNAMRASLKIPDATIEIVELSRYPVPRGTLSFPVAGLKAPPLTTEKSPVVWRGWQTYGSGKRYAVWARVRIWVERKRLVAAQDILPGAEIHEKDLVLEVSRYFPEDAEVPPTREVVIGRIAKVRIGAHTPVNLSALRPKRAVATGAAVDVVVASESMHLKFPAKAETAGGVGESVRVLNPATGRRFMAVVSGPNAVSMKVGSNEN